MIERLTGEAGGWVVRVCVGRAALASAGAIAGVTMPE